jgi:acetyltransferase-like isoleucine patch superfamily enzyme
MDCCAISGFRKLAIKLSFLFERGAFSPMTARQIMRQHFGIDIGGCSYGSRFTPGASGSPVTVGRCVSIAHDVSVYRRDHPTDRLSTHPFFYNSRLGYVPEDCITSSPLVIGHDAWIGSRAEITAGCSRIGLGSIVGAGAVVTRDVPDLAIVGGASVRVIRLRFTEKARARNHKQMVASISSRTMPPICERNDASAR